MKKLLALACIGALAGALATTSRAQDACSVETAAKTHIGQAISGGVTVSPGELMPVSYGETSFPARYFRALLDISAPAGATWHLTVRDQQLRPLETYGSAQGQVDGPRWTGRLDARQPVYLDLQSPSAQTRVQITRAVVMPESAQNPYYSLQDPDTYAFAPLYDAPSGKRRLGDHVGFLMSNWSTRSWCCSGVVVGDNLFLTNWHCGGDAKVMGDDGFWSAEVCRNTIIDISWDGDSVAREFVCSKVLQASKERDFALLRVRALKGDDVLRAPVVRRSAVVADERLTIVHHPACRAKQVSLECAVRDDRRTGWLGGDGMDFTYPCDTEGGSSGAPVFDKDNQLVGIHHLGFQRDAAGKCDKLNKGVRIQTILDGLADPHQRTLRSLLR